MRTSSQHGRIAAVALARSLLTIMALSACGVPTAHVVVDPHAFDPAGRERAWFVVVERERPNGLVLHHERCVEGEVAATIPVISPCGEQATLRGEVWRVPARFCETYRELRSLGLRAVGARRVAELEPVVLWPEGTVERCDQRARSYRVELHPPVLPPSGDIWTTTDYWRELRFEILDDDMAR